MLHASVGRRHQCICSTMEKLNNRGLVLCMSGSTAIEREVTSAIPCLTIQEFRQAFQHSSFQESDQKESNDRSRTRTSSASSRSGWTSAYVDAGSQTDDTSNAGIRVHYGTANKSWVACIQHSWNIFFADEKFTSATSLSTITFLLFRQVLSRSNL